MTTNENGRLLGGRAAAREQTKAHPDSRPHQAAAQPPQGRRAIITRLLSMCLIDARYCVLLDRCADGIVYRRVPSLRELRDLERHA